MLKVIKKPTVVLTVFMVAMATSCTNDDYSFFGDDDLNLNSQIPMTRSGSEQSTYGPNVNEFSYGENECCLVALVELQKQSMPNHSFCDTLTATNFYNSVKGYATSLQDDNGDPKYSGGYMDLDVFLEVGQHYNLINERTHFSNDAEKMDYFADEDNNPKVLHIDEYDEKKDSTYSHVARIISSNKKRGTVTYSSPSATFGSKTIDISEVKDVWQ